VVAREELRGDEIKTPTQFYVKEGDFVISRRQIIHGACGFVPAELDGAVVSNEYDVLRPRPELVPGFLRELVHTEYLQRTFFQSSVGVDVEKMVFDLEFWLQYELTLPHPTEQQSIAESLADADVAIEAAVFAAQQARRAKRAVVQGMMSRQKDWEVKTVGELVSHGPQNGLSPSANRHGTIKTFSIGAVREGRVDIEEHLKWVDVSESEQAKYQLFDGDILVVRGNANADLVGTCGLIGTAPQRCIYPDLLIRVRPSTSMLDVVFMEFFNADSTRAQIGRIAKTTNGTLKINGEDLVSIRLPLPPPDVQITLAEALCACRKVIDHYDSLCGHLTRLKTALQQSLLSGRLRVKV
jgi:type I restriction enzyme S subunit